MVIQKYIFRVLLLVLSLMSFAAPISASGGLMVMGLGNESYYVWTPISGTTNKYARWHLHKQKTVDLETLLEQTVTPFDAIDNVQARYSGTWTQVTGVNLYGGDLKYSARTNDYVEFTFSIEPGQTLALISYTNTNGGIANVTIDGKPSLANLLPTDVLGNRTIDFYGGATSFYQQRQKVPIAKSLSSGSHVLRITVSGNKHVSSSAARAFIDGIGIYNSTTTERAPSKKDFFAEGSVALTRDGEWEYAYSMAGVWWGGNTHGNEGLLGTKLTIDGVSRILAPREVVVSSNAQYAEQTRMEKVGYPNVAELTRLYEFTDQGLDLDLTTTWINPIQIRTTAYQGMFPVLDDSNVSTTGRFEGFANTYDLRLNTGANQGNLNSRKAYEFNSNNRRVLSLEIANLDSYAQSLNAFIWDKSDPGKSVYNKMYFDRITASYTPSKNEVWHSTNRYRVAY